MWGYGTRRRFRKANGCRGMKFTSPAALFPNGIKRFWRRFTTRMRMSDLRNARATAKAHISRETTRQFDVALHGAATYSIESMTLLHNAVRDCVTALRDGNVGAVDMILAMKACAHDSRARYRPDLDTLPVSNVSVLVDHIVKWAIAEYYRTAS